MGAAARRLRGALRWSIAEPEQFWRRVWDFCGVVGERQGGRRWSMARPDARRALLPRGAAQLRREPAAPARRRRRRRLLRRGQVKRRLVARRAATTLVSRLAQALARGRRRAGRPRRRLHAEHARDASRRCSPPPASARSGRPARRISACRACSTASARSSRTCSFAADGYCYDGKRIDSLGKRRARSCRALPTRRSRSSSCPISATRRRSRRRCRKARALARVSSRRIRRATARVRAAAVRPSALHPVLVGHDRRAEVHRARRRRHAAPASEGASSCTATSSAGDRVFYFTTCGWMMWNWLVSGLAVGRDAGALRRLAVPPGRQRCCSTSPSRAACTLFGTSAKFIDARRRRPALEPRETHNLSAPAHDHLDRLAAARRRASTSSTTTIKRRRAPRVDLRRHRHRLAASSLGNPDGAGLARRDPGAAASAWRSRSSTTTAQPRARARRASWSARAPFPVDAGRLLERPRRREVPRRLFRALPRRLVPRRLRRADRARRHHHLRPLRRRRSIPAACASAPPRSTARSSSSPRSLESLVIGQDWDGDVRIVLFVRLRDGVDARRRAARADHGADPRATPRRATCRRKIIAGRRHSAHQERQDRRARRARRRARPAGQEPRGAGQSGGARAVSRSRRS